jgi:uncharacterized membrane protein YagU involved in acid resistance
VPRCVVSILLGGFIAGTIDIGAACLISSASIPIILKAIAAGILGKASFQGGAGVAVLGLALQWAMSIVIAAIFYVISGKLLALRRHWVGAGLAYGVVIFVVMTYVVVPLSAVGHIPRFNAARFAENILAMLLFGLIVSYFAREQSRGVP